MTLDQQSKRKKKYEYDVPTDGIPFKIYSTKKWKMKGGKLDISTECKEDCWNCRIAKERFHHDKECECYCH